MTTKIETRLKLQVEISTVSQIQLVENGKYVGWLTIMRMPYSKTISIIYTGQEARKVRLSKPKA